MSIIQQQANLTILTRFDLLVVEGGCSVFANKIGRWFKPRRRFYSAENGPSITSGDVMGIRHLLAKNGRIWTLRAGACLFERSAISENPKVPTQAFR